MTDTTTYPLSTALSAALNSEATGPAQLIEDIIIGLMRGGAIGGPDPATGMNMPAFHAVSDAAGGELFVAIHTRGGLDQGTRRWAAERAVNALRQAGLIVEVTP